MNLGKNRIFILFGLSIYEVAILSLSKKVCVLSLTDLIHFLVRVFLSIYNFSSCCIRVIFVSTDILIGYY